MFTASEQLARWPMKIRFIKKGSVLNREPSAHSRLYRGSTRRAERPRAWDPRRIARLIVFSRCAKKRVEGLFGSEEQKHVCVNNSPAATSRRTKTDIHIIHRNPHQQFVLLRGPCSFSPPHDARSSANWSNKTRTVSYTHLTLPTILLV